MRMVWSSTGWRMWKKNFALFVVFFGGVQWLPMEVLPKEHQQAVHLQIPCLSQEYQNLLLVLGNLKMILPYCRNLLIVTFALPVFGTLGVGLSAVDDRVCHTAFALSI